MSTPEQSLHLLESMYQALQASDVLLARSRRLLSQPIRHLGLILLIAVALLEFADQLVLGAAEVGPVRLPNEHGHPVAAGHDAPALRAVRLPHRAGP
jgi:hypothetical protein